MSTTINTLLNDAKDRAARLALVAERYPDAHVDTIAGRQVIISDKARPDRVEVVQGDHGLCHCLRYEAFEGERIYDRDFWIRFRPINGVLERLRERYPEAYRLLVTL